LVAASSGASIASYTITVSDASINGGGYLVLNGATDLLSQTPDSNGGCTYKVSAADFSKVTYVAAGNHENEMTLTVSATSSGGLTSAPVNLAIEDGGFAGNRICHFLAEGTTLPLSQTVCLSEDRGGGPISSFLVSIPQSSNDVIHLNGAVNQLKNGAYNGYYEYQVSAADFNKMTITVGKSTGNLADDSLIFNIESNHYNSCPNPIVTAATAPSILLDNKAALAIGESVSFNSLLHYSSTPDLSKALFHIYDPTGGGQISLNGAANGELANVPNSDALPGEYTVSGSDLSKLTYTAGAGEESLLVSVSFDQGASWTSEVALTMSGTGGNPTIAQALQTPAAGPVAISDSAANFLANLDSVEALVADGKVLSVNLTDPGVPTLSLSAVELTQDARAIETVLGNVILSVPGISPDAAKFVVQQDAAAGAPLLMPGIASKGGVSVIGLSDLPNPGGTNLGGGYNVLVLDQAESDYTVTASHGSLTILDNYQYFVGQHTPPASYEVSGVSQIVFNGSGLGDAGQAAQTLFVLTPAQAQIASLYLAVLGRLPDSAGLAYYEAAQSANPSLSLSDLAQGFLSSAEYGANPAHSYAPSPAGDAQFITDIYSNLLHRAPAQGDVTWYQTNAINPMLSGLTPGTAAYAAAELKAHATVLVYVSHSPEFLADVQVTAQTPPDAQHWLLLA
jgi:hypothetical protein